jgi:hypothetical protein
VLDNASFIKIGVASKSIEKHQKEAIVCPYVYPKYIPLN